MLDALVVIFACWATGSLVCLVVIAVQAHSIAGELRSISSHLWSIRDRFARESRAEADLSTIRKALSATDLAGNIHWAS